MVFTKKKAAPKRRRASTAIGRVRRHKRSIMSWVGRGIAAGIAFGPVAVTTYQIYQANKSDNGYTAGSHLLACYTGYDIKSNTFPRFDKLAIGYVPVVGALVFKKLWSRVMR